MKKFLALLLVLSLSLPAQAQPTVINQVLKSVVQVLSYQGERNTSFCTGVVVGIDRAITARHCISDAESFTVDGQPSRVLKLENELALISIQVGSKSIIDVRKESVQIGDTIRTFGYAWGDMTILKRDIAAKANDDIIMDGGLAPGMSGGPVVDSNGKLAGINQGTTTVTSIACGVKEIRDIMGIK